MIAGIEYPEDWIKGQLLDLKRYGDGSFDAFLLGVDEKEARKAGQFISFTNGTEAQAFVSQWYATEAAR